MVYIGQGLGRDRVLELIGISKHQYYYRPKTFKRGKKKTSFTFKETGEGKVQCSNKDVVEKIKEVQKDPDTDYGYRKMTFQLRILGFIINHKKVYRLMETALLLKARHKGSDKQYVQFRIVNPAAPLEVFEMDIKQIWIVKDRRYAYILTIIDTFTRAALYWSMGYHMKKNHVKVAWEEIIINYLQPADLLSKGVHIELRNDNGPQFGANQIREFFKENYINQVFTHPYTPQENGHVESFHNILNGAVGKQIFWSMEELESRLETFYDSYNNKRIHASIAYLWPMKFWELWNEGKVTRIEKEKKKVKFTLNIPYQYISGNGNLREVSCSNLNPLDEGENLQIEEVNGLRPADEPNTPNYTTSVQRSPSVVSC